MPELRKDPVIGRWIIVATDRANRPQRYTATRPPLASAEDCPFCPGHEPDTPGEVLGYREQGRAPNGSDWWVRVVPNKYPALSVEGAVKRTGEGMYDMVSGVGAHEVVIECPNHHDSLATVPEKQVEEVIWAYRERVLSLKDDQRFQYILIFKNHGAEAGASLDHPHSQIIALPIIPKRVQEEFEGAGRYWEYKERCVFCDIIHQELKERARIVEESDSFVAILPYASRFPYETWIIPKRHDLHFHRIEKSELQGMASVLRRTLIRLRMVLNDPPYNYIIHTAALNQMSVPYYHWHIEIIPKMTQVAGFEWGTGFYINPLPPEQASRHLAAIDPEAARIVAIEELKEEA